MFKRVIPANYLMNTHFPNNSHESHAFLLDELNKRNFYRNDLQRILMIMINFHGTIKVCLRTKIGLKIR